MIINLKTNLNKHIWFPARFSKEEVTRLMDKICIYDEMSNCIFLYRNKSDYYFNDILQNQDGIMKPYIKDDSGDPRNPINGRINGLFFMASVSSSGGPIGDSPFGSRRCLIPAEELVNPQTHNLYFSDYFCMRGRRHYITLVVTKKNSDRDNFCRSALPLLDMYHNQFFRYDPVLDIFMVNSSDPYLLIEICYTENVDIKNATFKDVPTAGKGSSTPGGLRKNPSCYICNLR